MRVIFLLACLLSAATAETCGEAIIRKSDFCTGVDGDAKDQTVSFDPHRSKFFIHFQKKLSF